MTKKVKKKEFPHKREHVPKVYESMKQLKSDLDDLRRILVLHFEKEILIFHGRASEEQARVAELIEKIETRLVYGEFLNVYHFNQWAADLHESIRGIPVKRDWLNVKTLSMIDHLHAYTDSVGMCSSGCFMRANEMMMVDAVLSK